MKYHTFVKIEIIAVVLLLAGSAAWIVFQWGECRDMGFSFWYCIQHVI